VTEPEQMANRIEFVVTGAERMHCAGCEARVVRVLQRLPGVRDVKASHESQRVSVAIDLARVTAVEVQAAIKQAGFETAPVSD
jgi:copper chaperone